MKTSQKYWVVCTGCSYRFQRKFRIEKSLKGSTTCPRCKIKMLRSESVITRVKLERLMTSPVSTETIKGEQVPHSAAECIFKEKCSEKGWKPHRPSWPDFMVETDDGRLLFVEVKGKDRVSETQAATFEILENHGFPVYIWRNNEDCDSRLERWKYKI